MSYSPPALITAKDSPKMTDEEYKQYELKCRAKSAVDTILAAEQVKKDKELKSHIKAEMKERAKLLEAASGSKEKKTAPAKKSSTKKK